MVDQDQKTRIFIEELETAMEEAIPECGEDTGAQFEYVVSNKIWKTEEAQWEDDITGANNCVGDWGGGNDLGCDLWFENQTTKRILIIQCKYSTNYGSAINTTDIDHFFTVWQKLEDPQYVHDNANDNLKLRLQEYSQKIEEGYSVEFRLITTKNLNRARRTNIQAHQEQAHNDGRENFMFTHKDLGELNSYWNLAESLSGEIPEETKIKLDTGKYLVVDGVEHNYLVGVISGSELHSLYQTHYANLFNSNVREGLITPINKQIQKTIVDYAIDKTSKEPVPVASRDQQYFFYFNNGITALTEGFEVDDEGTVTARKLQIINGAQTTTAIAKAFDEAAAYGINTDEVEVMIRILEVESVDRDDSPLRERIIEYTNTQNAIKASDFRANDKLQRMFLQKRLENKVGDYKFYYAPKRGLKKPQGKVGKKIDLPTFGKMRHAYLYDPTDLFNDLDKLWDRDPQNGRYHKSFGVNGEVLDKWKEEYLNEGIFIVCLALHIQKESAERGVSLGLSLPSMRFHVLHLVGMELKLKNATGRKEIKDLIDFQANPDAFRERIDTPLKNAFQTVLTTWSGYVNQPDAPSAFKFKQYRQYWHNLKQIHKATNNL